jgi:hypothetical protein
MPVISALRRLGQKDYRFKASPWLYRETLSQKEKKKETYLYSFRFGLISTIAESKNLTFRTAVKPQTLGFWYYQLSQKYYRANSPLCFQCLHF